MPRNRNEAVEDAASPMSPLPAPPARRRISAWKRLAFAAVAVVITLVLLEGLSNIAWLIVDWGRLSDGADPVVELKEDYHCMYDAELGWAHIPGKHIKDFYEPGRHITINETGVRGLTPVVTPKPAGRFRLVCLGDSFTLGYGVGDEETYPHLLGEKHPSLETINMGQGGYSVGQCYLWYRRLADDLDADAVVMAVIVPDLKRLGIKRTVNGYATPQFSLGAGGEIEVSNIPVPPKLDVGAAIIDRQRRWDLVTQGSGLVRTLSKLTGGGLLRESDELESIAIGIEIIRRMQRLCAERGEQFALVLLPTLQDFEDEYLLDLYDAVSDHLRTTCLEMAAPYLDLSPEFKGSDNRDLLFLEEEYHHYSPRGNALVARELDSWLMTSLIGYPTEK